MVEMASRGSSGEVRPSDKHLHSFPVKELQSEIERRLPTEIETHVPPSVVIISEDGLYFVIGSKKGTISLYDGMSGVVLREVDYTTRPVTSLVLVEEEKVLIIGSKDGKIVSLTFPELDLRETIEVDGYGPLIKLYSADEVLLSCHWDEVLIVRATDLGDRQKISFESIVICFDITDDRLGIGLGNDTLEIWDKPLSVRMNCASVDKEITILKFSSNDRILAGGLRDFTVLVWDSNLEIMNKIDNHKGLITGLGFMKSDVILVTASEDSNIMCWNLYKRRAFIKLRMYNSPITSIICKDNMIISSQLNNMLLRWRDPGNIYNIRYKDGDLSIIDLEFFESSKKIATINTRNEITIWDYTLDCIIFKEAFTTKLNRMSISKCEQFILISSDKPALYRLDLDEYKITEVSSNSIITCIKFHSNLEWVITGDTLNRLILWKLPEMDEILSMKGHYKHITAACLIEEKDQVISGSKDSTLILWDLCTGNKISKFIGHERAITNVRVQKNNIVAISSSLDGNVILWDITKSLILYKIQQDSPIRNLITTKDERYFITVNEKNASFWDLTTQSKISSITSSKHIKNIAISKDQQLLAIAEEGTLFLRTNPLCHSSFDLIGTKEEYAYSFMKYIGLILNGDYSMPHIEEFNQWVIAPYLINVIHVFAYMNCPDRIRQALKSKSSSATLFNTRDLESALSLAINRNFVECINILLKYMNKQSFQNLKSLAPLESCISQLNVIDLNYLPILYNNLLRKVKAPHLSALCSSYTDLPIIVQNSHMYILSEKFFDKNDANLDTQISFYTSIIPLSLNVGSSKGIEFLESLLNTPQDSIYDSLLIEYYLRLKWKQIGSFIYTYAIIGWLFLLSLTLYCILYRDKDYFLIVPMALNIPLLLYEIIQMILEGSKYWKNFWNYLDISLVVLFTIFASCKWTGANYSLEDNLLIMTVVATYIRSISYFRIFQTTRYMVHLIIEVIMDMRGFLILLLYSTIAFGIILSLLPSNEDEKFLAPLAISYLLDLGDFHTDNYSAVDWAIFIIATIINPIIMLNLLIAIMSHTYERVQSTIVIADRKELLEMIIEIEKFFFWNRKKNDRSYLQVCESDSIVSDQPKDSLKIMKRNIRTLNEKIFENEQLIREVLKEGENTRRLLEENNMMMKQQFENRTQT